VESEPWVAIRVLKPLKILRFLRTQARPNEQPALLDPRPSGGSHRCVGISIVEAGLVGELWRR
jgi:hypothetical protein